jgi:hypothetical protein
MKMKRHDQADNLILILKRTLILYATLSMFINWLQLV